MTYWREPVWHRHSCLCFGKIQCLILLHSFRAMSTAFVPPNANEFDITQRMS